MNKLIFRLHILSKISDLEEQCKTVTSVDEVHRMEGKLEVLKELFEDFNLEYDPEEKLEFHNNF
jgi:Holliday junction resolvasome RuvABC ATP-dependent DNA helicase subunit